jgi:hypothetical protein
MVRFQLYAVVAAFVTLAPANLAAQVPMPPDPLQAGVPGLGPTSAVDAAPAAADPRALTPPQGDPRQDSLPQAGAVPARRNPGPVVPQAVPPPSATMSQEMAATLKAVDQNAWRAPKPAPHQYDVGAARYPWKAGIVVHVRMGVPATVILPEWVSVQTAIPGVQNYVFLSALTPNSLLIQALQPKKGFGVTLVTNAGVLPLYVRTYLPTGPDDQADFVTDQTVEITLDRPAAQDMPQIAASTGPTTAPPTRFFGLLPPYMQRTILVPSQLTVPHIAAQRQQGDYDIIGPLQVVDDGIRTYFNFGPKYQARPRPAIKSIIGGVERPVNIDVLDDKNGIVVAYHVGDFILRWEGHVVCFQRTARDDAGLPGSIVTGGAS